MSDFEIPTMQELVDQQRLTLSGAFEVEGADPAIPRAVWPVLAATQAQGVWGAHQHLLGLSKQTVPIFSTGEYLAGWAGGFGLKKKPKSRSTGSVTISGVAGGAVPSTGIELTSTDGSRFKVTEGLVLTGDSGVVNVEAITAGAAGNLPASAKLTFSTAIENVDATAIVQEPGLAGGADEESDPQLWARLQAVLSAPPQGGEKTDFENWALEVSGVTRAWCSPKEQGAGTATIRFMMDDIYDDGIPLGDTYPDYSGDVKTVHDHIDELHPCYGGFFVCAPIAVPLNIQIEDLSNSSPEIQAAIEAEVAALIRRDSAPGVTLFRSRIVEAISYASGETSHTLIAPAGDVAHEVGEIAVLGTVTFA